MLKMEFLHPTHNDPGQIILLLVVSRQGKSRLVWYEWNKANDLWSSQLRATRYSLPPEESVPLLLIPLINRTTFMLVCEGRITLFRDILTGAPTRYVQRLECEKAPEEPGSSKRWPLWTQWARPMRAEGHRFTNVEDAIYLCREDGIVQYLEFHNNVDHVLNSTHQAGRLGVNAETAFAILDVGPSTLDLIVVGGDESEGGLWRVEPRTDETLLVDAIANWAPLTGLTVAKDLNGEPSVNVADTEASLAHQYPQRMFACVGRNKHGAMSELRYGTQASKIVPFGGIFNLTDELRDEIGNGVLNMWAFHGFFGKKEFQYVRAKRDRLMDVTYILISHPTRTSLLFMPVEQEPALVEDSSLGLGTKTIFASITASYKLIQVTDYSIILSRVSQPDDKDGKSFQYQGVHSVESFTPSESSSRFMCACIHNDRSESMLLVAIQREGQFFLQAAKTVERYEPIGKEVMLDSQPCSMHLYDISNILLAFVATVDCRIQIFLMEQQGPVLSTARPYTFLPGPFAICDSIAIMTSGVETDTVSRLLVVCGLRNGSIQTLYCNGEGSAYYLDLCEERIFGTTSVTVITDVTRKSRVICHCEQALCTLEYPKYSPLSSPAEVRNVWMTDFDRPALTQDTLSSITQIDRSWEPEGVPGLTSGALIGISKDLLQVLRLDPDSDGQLVPHRLTIGAEPERLIYSRFLDRLIILYAKLRVSKNRRRNRSERALGTRSWEHVIRFLNPDTMTSVRAQSEPLSMEQDDQYKDNDEVLASECKPTERFRHMTEWFPAVERHVWHYLVIGTEFDEDSTQKGHLLFLRVDSFKNGKPRLMSKFKLKQSAPVHCVASYPNSNSIIYCSGNRLCLLSLDITQTDRWTQTRIKVEMRSPVRYLSVKAPYIYVSSSRESLAVYKHEDGKLIYLYGDQSARSGLHHVHFPEHSLILASDLESTVVGLWQPPERRISNTMTPVFEAILPGSITCLTRVTRPVWGRDADKLQENQSVIGSSIDGAITQFDILVQGWRLLRFIQNMAERDATVCPFKNHDRPFKRHIEPSTSKPHYMHVNGDIIQRVIERGGEQLIRVMLDKEPELDDHTDFDSGAARWERFKELAGEVVDTEDRNWLGHVVQWIRYRLLNAL